MSRRDGSTSTPHPGRRAGTRAADTFTTGLRATLATASSAAVLGMAATIVAPTTLAATPAIIMGGTGMPTPTQAYVDGAVNHYITPALGGSYSAVATYTPEEGLGTLPGETMSILESAKAGIPYLKAEMARHPGEPLVIFGYSQSGAIAIQVKKELAAYADANPDEPVPDVTFVVIGTGARPNGALQYRLGDRYETPILDERTRLDTPFKTIDIAMQYDIATDAPLYPINLLADINWLLGGLYVHNNYLPLQDPYDQYNTPVMPSLEGLQGVTKPGIDTTFYFIPTADLPLFGPLRTLGIPEAFIDIIEPIARVMVEWGYDRTIAPWEPTTFRLIPRINPITATADLVRAAGEGFHNALKAFGLVPRTTGEKTALTTGPRTVSDHAEDDSAAERNADEPSGSTTATSVESSTPDVIPSEDAQSLGSSGAPVAQTPEEETDQEPLGAPTESTEDAQSLPEPPSDIPREPRRSSSRTVRSVQSHPRASVAASSNPATDRGERSPSSTTSDAGGPGSHDNSGNT